MENSYVEENSTSSNTQEIPKIAIGDGTNLISLGNELDDNVERPSSSNRPAMARNVRGESEGKSLLSISNDCDDFLDDKSESLHENVIHLLASEDLQVQSLEIKEDEKQILTEKDLAISLTMDVQQSRPVDASACIADSIQNVNEKETVDSSSEAICLNEIRENESPYLVVVNNATKNIQSATHGKKKIGPGKRTAKPKSRQNKIQKTEHLLPEVNQNTNFLSGATMILDQQGHAITEIQPAPQLNGLYTVQIPHADPGLPSVVNSVTSVQQSLAFETIPATSVSLQGAHAATSEPVNQQWFTTKDDKSSMQVKGMKWKQGMWSKDEVDLLKENIEKYCKLHEVDEPSQLIFYTSKDQRKHFYRSIAKGISRPLFAIYRKTLRLYDFKNYIGKYTEEEVAKLERLHAKYGHDWATIGHCMGRSAASVKDRCRLLRKNKKSGRWTDEEENILSQCVREQTNTKEGESITSGVTWSIVAEKLGTRTEKQCRSKWLNYLNWKEVSGKEWTKNDEVELIERISRLNVEDEIELNWAKLADQWPSARSPQWLRGKWWAIKKHVPDYKNLNFHAIMNYLQTTHLDALRVKIDRQTVALASTFSVNPTSLPLHSGDHLSNHTTVGTLATSDSSSDVLDAGGLSNTHSHSIINTSTIDLASLQGYQLQFQLASLSPHQLLIPVNSTGIASNLADHFVIPVNMTSAIITSAADHQQAQAGYIVHNVGPATDTPDVVSSSRHVELTQALVQTDLSIPIPAGDISQENLSAANMEAISSSIVVGLEGHSLASPTVTQASPHHEFDETISLIPDDSHVEERDEIIVPTERCRVKRLEDYGSDHSSVKVVKVDQIDCHDLDSP